MPIEFFIGKVIDEFGLPKKYTSKFKDDYNKVFKTGETQNLEYELPTVEGDKFFYTTTVPEFNSKGDIRTALSVVRDITERKRGEEQLKETIKELKRSNDELQQFAYITSHDLQEPLRTIASFTQLLERRYKNKLDSDADEFIDFIVDAALRMKEMIQGLLNYSKVGTGGREFEHVDTNEVLKTSINGLNALIEGNKAIITNDPLPTIIADRNQMIQIFQNLMGNAIKFRKPEEPPKIHISATNDEEKNEYVFSVADNSIGMEKEYTDKIFEIFKRLHTIDKYEGSGIGLAIVKRIVDRHGGRVWVESDLGKGSTFYFTIPDSIQGYTPN
jgi:light-regulated signal transduction histidine kinase (bacteriophytochrome)